MLLAFLIVLLVLIIFASVHKKEPNSECQEKIKRKTDRVDRYIGNIMNTNGIIYRQHQRELSRLSHNSRLKKQEEASRAINDFLGQQKYIEEHTPIIQKDILRELMRHIRPYLTSEIENPRITSDHCREAWVLATDVGAMGDLKIISAVAGRCGVQL